MTIEPHDITDTLVRRLVTTQFPQFADLPIRRVALGGWDNTTFHLGEDMIARLPSAAKYAVQVDKESRWLPKLAPFLPLAIPVPLAIGEPAEGYPWRWSIYRWLDGVPAAHVRINDLRDFAARLARFLAALQCIDPTGGPRPGPHNFYRGGTLATYDAETRQALTALAGRVDVGAARRVWDAALATTWQAAPL